MSDPEEQTNILRWITHVIAIERVNAPWVTNPRKIITKASLFFVAKF